MKNLKIWLITESCGDSAVYHLSYGNIEYTSLLNDVQDIVSWENIEDIFSDDTKEYIEQLLERSHATKEFLENINICDAFDLDVSKIYEGEEGAKEYFKFFIDELKESRDFEDLDEVEGSEQKNMINAIQVAIKNGCKERALVMAALDEISNYYYDISSCNRVNI